MLVMTDASAAMALSGEEPYEALQRGDFRVAGARFLPLAEKGDARAQYNLGLLYASGLAACRTSHQFCLQPSTAEPM